MAEVNPAVADGVAFRARSGKAAAPKAPPPVPSTHQPSKAMKMTGMSREVMELLNGSEDTNSAALPPIVPAFPLKQQQQTEASKQEGTSVKVGNKWISSAKPAREWVWAPFASSARTDGAMFRHWVRAGVEYPDYPYARFDIHLDAVTYTDEEYEQHLQHETWTKSETDKLMELARIFELRWPVIYDRWNDAFYSQHTVAKRKIEDLQHRYYEVAATLTQNRICQEAAAEVRTLSSATPAAATDASRDAKSAQDRILLETAAARSLASSDPKHQPLMHNLGTGTSNKVFDLIYERERRAHLDRIWNRTKEEEEEEAELRKELRLVETQLRKLKKSGGHILAASANGGGASGSGVLSSTSAASSRNPSRSASPVPNIVDSPALLDKSFASTAPTPMPQTPYLQSGRLVPPATGGLIGLNKTLLNRMDTVLAELKVPPRPMPTKRVCDMYDAVRKDVLTLLALQKMALQKEGQLQAKRVRLSKLGGNVTVVDEETLMGITPAGAPGATSTAAATTPAAKSATAGGKAPRGKGKTAAPGGKAKGAVAKGKADETTPKDPPAGGGKQARKPAAKRKRKSTDAKSPTSAKTTAAAAAAAAAAVAATVTATTTNPPIAPVAAPAPVGATEQAEVKASGKKRARK